MQAQGADLSTDLMPKASRSAAQLGRHCFAHALGFWLGFLDQLLQQRMPAPRRTKVLAEQYMQFQQLQRSSFK